MSEQGSTSKDSKEAAQQALEDAQIERHNQRKEKKRAQKKRTNFAIGSVFPSQENEQEEVQKVKENEQHIDPKALKYAVDYVFNQGYMLGLENLKRLHAHGDEDHQPITLDPPPIEHHESDTLNDDASQAPSQALSQIPLSPAPSSGARTPSLAPSFTIRPGVGERSSSLIPPFVTKSSFRTIRKDRSHDKEPREEDEEESHKENEEDKEPEGKKHQIGGIIPDNRREQQDDHEDTEDMKKDHYETEKDKDMKEKMKEDLLLEDKLTQHKSYKNEKNRFELDMMKSRDDESFKSANTRQKDHKKGNLADEDSDDDGGDDENYEGQIGGELENKHEEAPEAQERIKEEEDPNTDSEDYNWWFRVREVVREPLAEFLATCIAIIIGLGANTQTMVYTQNLTAAYSNRNLASSLGATVAIYVAGGISGAHINPAITFMLAVYRGFPWSYVPRYWLAQILGAFVAAALVWACYGTDITYLDPMHQVKGDGSTAGLFVIQPYTDTGTPVGVCVFQEILASAILTVSVLSLGDAENAPPGASLGGLIIGLVIYSIGTAMGSLSGYATNPVRDLSPRIFLAAVGYNSELWTHDSCWFVLGPILGTFAGTIAGATIYDTFIYIGIGSPINFSKIQWVSAFSRTKKSIVKAPSRTARRSHNMVRYVVGAKDKNEKRRADWERRQKKGDKAV